MLRPERMSRVSVTGSKPVMDDVIEAIYELNLFDMTDYDGAWEGFDPGDPIEGADAASEKLVTVRSLQSLLGVDADADAGPTRIVTDEALEEELEEIRVQVNELDDRRDDVEDDLRAVEERLDAMRPFVELGIDLDLLAGYDNLSVAVGEGDEEAVRRALADGDGIDSVELFSAGDAVAAFVYPADVALDDLLVGAQFTAVEVPDVEETTDPEEYVAELEHRRQQLASKLDTIEDEIEDLRLDVGGFLLAAEEKLAIETQKREAPLSFATTENAFVAEGWIPTERFVDLAEGLQDAVGDHVEVEELERADYDEHGFATAHEPTEEAPSAGTGEGVAADGGDTGGPGTDGDAAPADARPDGGETSGSSRDPSARRADGGHARGGDRVMSGGEPPVVQDNPAPVKPFEMLVDVINRPKYWELDPTIVFFLTFPVMYGFMIGDLGYGLLYMAIGYWLMTAVDSDALQALGYVGVLSGLFTAVFGVLYGEIFGMHVLGDVLWGGTPPIHKGLQPAESSYALLWLTVSLLAGLLHVSVGYVFGFLNDLSHGLREAVTENASWLILMLGVWVWIFSGASGRAPAFLVGPQSVFNGHPVPLGFTGFPDVVGLAGGAAAVVGLALLVAGEGAVGLLESLNVLVNVLSYARIAAVLLAKAGMAFVVNLLFFGVYVTHTEHGEAWHFATGHLPHVGDSVHGHTVTSVMFPGLIHMGVAAVLLGIVVVVVGHALVLALGVTSAGLQAVRLEYVEFFQKFYQGGGRTYSPFGYVRRFTTED